MSVACGSSQRESVVSAIFAIIIFEMRVVSVVVSHNTSRVVECNHTATTTFCTGRDFRRGKCSSFAQEFDEVVVCCGCGHIRPNFKGDRINEKVGSAVTC